MNYKRYYELKRQRQRMLENPTSETIEDYIRISKEISNMEIQREFETNIKLGNRRQQMNAIVGEAHINPQSRTFKHSD